MPLERSNRSTNVDETGTLTSWLNTIGERDADERHPSVAIRMSNVSDIRFLLAFLRRIRVPFRRIPKLKNASMSIGEQRSIETHILFLSLLVIDLSEQISTIGHLFLFRLRVSFGIFALELFRQLFHVVLLPLIIIGLLSLFLTSIRSISGESRRLSRLLLIANCS